MNNIAFGGKVHLNMNTNIILNEKLNAPRIDWLGYGMQFTQQRSVECFTFPHVISPHASERSDKTVFNIENLYYFLGSFIFGLMYVKSI